MKSNGLILCFGEILWDCLPRGLFPGGAPMNVAYHLRRHGVNALPVTAIGKDILGAELLRRLKGWGVDTRYVTTLPAKPTGTVQVELDKSGKPHYEIVERVAWDHIPVSPRLLAQARSSKAIVFGSLAQRTPHNRKQLARILEAAREPWKVFDINLRPPFDDLKLVRALMRRSNLIKLNDEELGRFSNRKLSPTQLEGAARKLGAEAACERICVTAGPHGAGLLWDGKWYWEKARKIQVKDSVGAGDSFLASLLHSLLFAETPVRHSLAKACRLAEFVASSDGATPAYDVH
ncbi:MAG: kdgK 2 [Verrucomicrobiales bacterium]|nr:kdgK 2 [Verrucomicrobiales bacterium]